MQSNTVNAPTKSDAAELITKPPLWLPPGSIRALLTVTIVIIYFTMNWQGMEIPETMNNIVITVIAFYFGVRTASPTEVKVYDENAAEIKNIQQGESSLYDDMPDRNPANPEGILTKKTTVTKK